MKDTTGYRMVWQQALDDADDEVARWAEDALSDARMAVLRRDMRLAQLNNLLGVTLETNSPHVVRNWVHYQMGRRDTRRAWDESGLGKVILEDLARMRELAQRVVAVAQSGVDENKLRETHIALIRRYAGFLKRWFVAKGGQQG